VAIWSSMFRKTAWRTAASAATAAVLGSAMAGCASHWDDITSREFNVKNWFTPEDPPLVVLQHSDDGEKRARALARLDEPLRNGGTQKEQDDAVEILKNAATTERTPLCRMAALQTLGHYKDTRAPEIIETVYLDKLAFNSELNGRIREQCLNSLIETGGPVAMHRLVLVAKEPASTGSEQERKDVLDRRLAAVRGLAKFQDPEAAATLVQLLRTEKDNAMRDRAFESLQTCTGKHMAADSKQWDAYLPSGTDVHVTSGPQQQTGVTPASATGQWPVAH
jgi:hypothetical protein